MQSVTLFLAEKSCMYGPVSEILLWGKIIVERAGGCGMAKKVRTVYREPEDFIPEKVRRELKLGEFAQGEEEKKDEKPEGSKPSEEK